MTNILTHISFWLVIIGALNWGLIGIFDFNLVSALFGELSFISRLVYILVFASACWLIYSVAITKEPIKKVN